MPQKKKAKPQKAKEGVLITAAKTIGRAAGRIAALVGGAKPDVAVQSKAVKRRPSSAVATKAAKPGPTSGRKTESKAKNVRAKVPKARVKS